MREIPVLISNYLKVTIEQDTGCCCKVLQTLTNIQIKKIYIYKQESLKCTVHGKDCAKLDYYFFLFVCWLKKLNNFHEKINMPPNWSSNSPSKLADSNIKSTKIYDEYDWFSIFQPILTYLISISLYLYPVQANLVKLEP